MRTLLSGLLLALTLATTAGATTYTYSFSGNFSRWYDGTSSFPVGGPYTGAFGGTFSYDSALDSVTDWDLSMDFRYNSGTIETLDFVEGATRHAVDLSAGVVAFTHVYNLASSPLQNRIRLYLDDTSSWGDRTVTFDYVWGDVDSFTGGSGFVGTSPHNNTTPTSGYSLVAVSQVPLPATLPLVLAGVGAVALLRRRRRA